MPKIPNSEYAMCSCNVVTRRCPLEFLSGVCHPGAKGDEGSWLYARGILQLLHDRDRILVVGRAVAEIYGPVPLVEENHFRSQKFQDSPSSRVPSAPRQCARLRRR